GHHHGHRLAGEARDVADEDALAPRLLAGAERRRHRLRHFRQIGGRPRGRDTGQRARGVETDRDDPGVSVGAADHAEVQAPRGSEIVEEPAATENEALFCRATKGRADHSIPPGSWMARRTRPLYWLVGPRRGEVSARARVRPGRVAL